MNFEEKIQVVGEEPFRVLSNSLWIPSTSAGYEFQYSGDGVSWIDHEDGTVEASIAKLFKDIPSGLYCKLKNNTDTLTVLY